MTIKASERAGALHPISFRATSELRRKLEEAASTTGVSITQEITARLDRSFGDLPSGDDPVAVLMRSIGAAVHLTEMRCKGRFIDSETVADLCRTAAIKALDGILGTISVESDPDFKIPDRWRREAADIGKSAALHDLLDLHDRHSKAQPEIVNKLLTRSKLEGSE